MVAGRDGEFSIELPSPRVGAYRVSVTGDGDPVEPAIDVLEVIP